MITDVAKWIEERGMTPLALARELDIPRGQISRFIAREEDVDPVIGWALVGLGTVHPPVKTVASATAPTGSLPDELSDDTWSGVTARLALPILIEMAQKRPSRCITYGELHDEVVKRGGKKDIGRKTKYAFPLGRIATSVQDLGDGIPPLTSIVVSKTTGLPSPGIDGYIKKHLGLRGNEARKLKDPDGRRELCQVLWDQVFEYKKWPKVQSLLGLTGNPDYDM